MILRKLYIIPLLFLAVFASGQTVDFNRVVTPVEFRARTFTEYLVQLAWMNNPDNDVLAEEIDIAKEELDITKWEWAKDFRAIASYNETNLLTDLGIRPNTTDAQEVQLQRFLQTLVVPRFSVSATLNLGTLITLPKEKRVAEYKINIAEHKLNQEKHQIRAEVLERYQNYLLAIEVLKTRTLAEEDASTMYSLLDKLFKEGEAEFKDWNAASTTYWAAVEGKSQAQTEIERTIIKLEEIIGIKWDDALRMKKRYGE